MTVLKAHKIEVNGDQLTIKINLSGADAKLIANIVNIDLILDRDRKVINEEVDVFTMTEADIFASLGKSLT